MLSLENVKLRHGSFLLDVDSLQIEDGETIAVMGISGSGKTTLLEILSGLEKADEGEVHLPDEMSFGYQNPYLQFFTEKVSSEILFSKGKLDRKTSQEIVSKALGEFMLPSSYGEKSPYELSGGEARRVLLASLSSDDRKYLFLDECLAGLDEKGETTLENLLESRRASGKCTIYTSHDPDFSALADRLLVMQSGKLVYDGNPRDVLSSSAKAVEFGLNPTYYASIAESMGLSGILCRDELVDAIIKSREAGNEM